MVIFPKIKGIPPEEQKITRHNLLKYCELDTYAMVKVWEKLADAAEKKIGVSRIRIFGGAVDSRQALMWSNHSSLPRSAIIISLISFFNDLFKSNKSINLILISVPSWEMNCISLSCPTFSVKG